MRLTFACRVFAGLMVFVGAGGPMALAQPGQGWTATSLHPTVAPLSAATYSLAWACDATQQVGQIVTILGDRGTLWTGTPASCDVSSHVNGYFGSFVRGVSGPQRVGWVWTSNNIYKAALWNGSAAWVDLTPPNSIDARALATNGTQQVGYAAFNARHAMLWRGTASSWVDLHPPGAVGSVAAALSATQQGGSVGFSIGESRACLWSGTAASWVDLSPPGTTNSLITCMTATKQGGYASVQGATHAGIWSGTAQSWVDLHPSGATESYIYAMSGDRQAGYVIVAGDTRAGVWTGSPGSWVDLHAFVPVGFASSRAFGIANDGVNWYVCGGGFNRTTGRMEAILWTRPFTCPADYNASGDVSVQDAYDFLTAWFSIDPRADFNNAGGVTVQDIFDFLAAWFAGC